MQGNTLKHAVQPELKEVDQLIIASLHSKISMISEVASYLLGNSNAKRLRPLLVLLVAQACDYQGNMQITMAAVMEFIHAATLLHDDVIDKANSRRNKATVNQVWGSETAILVGDFLYSRAFQLMLNTNDIEILKIIADATNTIAEGEILQLLKEYDTEHSQDLYLKIISNKTAKLFAACCEVAAVLAKCAPEIITKWQNFGMYLGIAYQLIDDLLDYKHDLETNNIGMPCIYLLQNGNTKEQELSQSFINQQNVNIKFLGQAIENSKALEYTKQLADKHIELAKQEISNLPNNAGKLACIDMADFVISRNF